MYIIDWGEVQEADPLLATCRRQLCTCKDSPFPRRDTLLKKYFSDNVNMEERHALFCMHNGLVMSKGLLYIGTMPKGEVEGILAFLIPTDQLHVTLNTVHCDAGHQCQQRTLAFTQERFWWPMMVEDCCSLVQDCQWSHIFEGAILKAPLCPIRAHTLLELVHIDVTSVELTMDLNRPPTIKNVLVITDHFTCYTLAFFMRDQTAKTMAKVLYE